MKKFNSTIVTRASIITKIEYGVTPINIPLKKTCTFNKKKQNKKPKKKIKNFPQKTQIQDFRISNQNKNKNKIYQKISIIVKKVIHS